LHHVPVSTVECGSIQSHVKRTRARAQHCTAPNNMAQIRP